LASLSLSSLSWKAQLTTFVIVSVAMAGAFYQYVDTPRRARIKEAQDALATVQARIDQGREAARKLPEFRKEVARLEAELDSLRPILPEEKDAADLLRRVHTLAVQSNLTIISFRPQAVNTKDLHAEWPITLQLEGTYHNFGLFLDRVSKFPRIINVGNMKIDPAQDASSSASMKVECTAMTFVLIEPKPAEANKKGAAAKAPKTAA
jgi:type IV pilus assembly protein PilO